MRSLPVLKGVFNEDLRKLREFYNLSQRAVCRLSGDKITSPHYSSLESGEISKSHPETVRILSKVFEVPYLLMMYSAGYVTKQDLQEYEEIREYFFKILGTQALEKEEYTSVTTQDEEPKSEGG